MKKIILVFAWLMPLIVFTKKSEAQNGNTKYKLAIFIDGEFWHGYNWLERKENLKSNRGFWIPKIERNMQRDREVNRQLEEMSFTVFRFWANEIKHNLDQCINDILVFINTGQND